MSSGLFDLDTDDWSVLCDGFTLADVIAARLIVPVRLRERDYRDLGQLAPDYLVTIHRPVARQAIDSLASKGGLAFPVLIDIAKTHNTVAPSGSVAAELGRVMPVADGTVIRFRSQDELKRFTEQSFADIRTDVLQMLVDPSAFAGTEDTFAQDSEWLGALGGGPIDAGPLVTADRGAGGVMLVLAASADLDGLQLSANLLGDDLPLRNTVDACVLAHHRGTAGKDGEFVFNEIAAAFVKVGAEGLRPLSLLDDVDARLAALLDSNEYKKQVAPRIDKARAVLDNRSDFEPFRAEGPLPSLRSMFMALMRPTPRDLLTWKADEHGASPAEFRAAAYLCGLLYRRSDLPLTYRPAAVDSVVATAVAISASSGSSRVQPICQPQIETLSTGHALLVNGQRIAEVGRGATGREILQQLSDLTSAEVDDLVAFCDAHGLGNQVTFTLEMSGEVTMAAERGRTIIKGAGKPALHRSIDPVALARLIGDAEDPELLESKLPAWAGGTAPSASVDSKPRATPRGQGRRTQP